MLKTTTLLLAFFLGIGYSFSQSDCTSCPDYQTFLQKGIHFFNKKNYDAALPEFQAAQIAARICNCKTKQPNEYITKSFAGIEEQKKKAERLEKESKKNLALAQQQKIDIKKSIQALENKSIELKNKSGELEGQKTKAKNTLIKVEAKQQEIASQQANNRKLIDAFYFYGDSLALAFNNRKYGFINKNGDLLIEYKYDKAEPFDDKGLAEVEKRERKYLIDTKGNEYKVAYKIEDLADDVLALDLREMKLDSFPTEVLEHPQLEILILDQEWSLDENIKSIPDEILDLKNLKYLSLIDTEISELPADFGKLGSLVYLNLSGTGIKELPDSFGQLNSLRDLNLKFTKAKKLPASFGQLSSLQNLDLLGAEIIELPASFGELGSLQELDLESSEIIQLPASFGQLASLRKLNLSETKVKEFPDNFAQLGSLQDLDLFQTAIPKEAIDLLQKQLPECSIFHEL